MTKLLRHKWRSFDKGMVTAVDPRDVPAGYLTYAQNVDYAREYGTLRKSYGFDRHDVDQPLPENFPPVLSMGWMTYTNENDAKMGRLVVQTNGSSTGYIYNTLDWYFRDYDFDGDTWVDWNAGVPNSLSQEDIYGTTKADRIRWTSFHEVMRGACGNESDSYPLWFGFIDRNADDNEGYFHNYTTVIPEAGDPATTTGDRDTFVGVATSQSIPNIKCGILQTTDGFFGTDLSTYINEKVRYLIVPILDGHQITSPNNITNYSSLRVNWEDANKNPRLSGFNIYESRTVRNVASSEEAYLPPFPYWELIKYVDIRTGNDVPIYSDNGTFNSSGNFFAFDGMQNRFDDNDAFNGLWIHILYKTTDGTNIDEWYKITDHGMEANDGRIYFTPHGNTALVGATSYRIDVMEKWDSDTTDSYYIELYVDGNAAIQPAPDGLPDPNKLADSTYDYPEISCNYKRSILFEERHVVGNVYFDGKKHPLMMRWSNPINDPFAGHDIFPNYVMIPSTTDDEIMGFAQSLNVLSVFTKRKIFKYVFENGVPVLQETPYSAGLVAPDSLVTINGIHWFFGQEGQILSIFRYDGIREPQDVGAGIRDQIEAWMVDENGLTRPHIQPHLTLGWRDYRTGQYRIALNTYSEGDPWYLPGSPGSPGLKLIGT
jgi:hypothetical protein